MTTYRVPVQLRDVPGPDAAPAFQDVKDFWDQLVDALGTFARIGSSFDADISVDAVKAVNDLRHNVYVVIQDPGAAGVPVLEGQQVTGAAAAQRVVECALVQIGHTDDTAKVDTDSVAELQDPTGS
ncbi:hypothetical protein ACGFIF_44185 [Kribbella sp. NPDC049174]|uniref:hypothetical protein n=1 Tax=Kribbella sp. NPDC049174 TaxID=3364112 RepID=UPI003718C640